MERKRNALQLFLAAAGLLVLILDSRVALNGARSGVELCIKTVIPSLFPFFVLSMILADILTEYKTPSQEKLAWFLGIPPSGVSVLVPAVLGGYPVGAKCIGDLYQQNQLTRQDAEHLLSFCSNAGPSFLFGMISGFFPEKKLVWLLWFIHLLSAALTAVSMPAEKAFIASQSSSMRKDKSVILSAAKAITLVCCWVILFRIIISFLDAWFLWLLPEWIRVLLIGILELTNGCCELLQISNIPLRFILCACMLSIGGICVLLQTASVIHGLSVRSYCKGKLIQASFSLLLSCAVVSKQVFFAAIVPILVIILRKTQKKCSNLKMLPV